jgi:hypothetical protein
MVACGFALFARMGRVSIDRRTRNEYSHFILGTGATI